MFNNEDQLGALLGSSILSVKLSYFSISLHDALLKETE